MERTREHASDLLSVIAESWAQEGRDDDSAAVLGMTELCNTIDCLSDAAMTEANHSYAHRREA